MKITKEQKMQITELAQKMEKQSNRLTQYPLFYVYEKYDQWVNSEDSWDKMLWFSDDEGDTVDVYIDDNENEWKWDHETSKWSCEALTKEYDEYDFEDKITDTLRRVHVKTVDKPAIDVGPFFTEEAANEHIRLNHYHYNQPFIYVNSAWRNYEMQDILKLVFTLAGKEIPSQYK